MKAIKNLEVAFKECKKEKVYFHVILDTFYAFNGDVVREVDDNANDGIPLENSDRYSFTPTLNVESWADDQHYVHLKTNKT